MNYFDPMIKKKFAHTLGIFITGVAVYAAMYDGLCPRGMILLDNEFCIDKYEAPNKKNVAPLVMYSFVEASLWCKKKSKRLCFDDEWERACVGIDGAEWSYGDKYEKGICNDSRKWLKYTPKLLWDWLPEASNENISSFEQQLKIMRKEHPKTAEHVDFLYQANPSGFNKECNKDGVYDLLGNVEEWTKRRVSVKKYFSGKLKGRFWAESRKCTQSVSNHGDLFRFYETGFRCCKDSW